MHRRGMLSNGIWKIVKKNLQRKIWSQIIWYSCFKKLNAGWHHILLLGVRILHHILYQIVRWIGHFFWFLKYLLNRKRLKVAFLNQIEVMFCFQLIRNWRQLQICRLFCKANGARIWSSKFKLWTLIIFYDWFREIHKKICLPTNSTLETFSPNFWKILSI